MGKFTKKLKKGLKKAAPLIMAGLAARALMKRRGSATAANVDSGRGSGLRKTNVGPQFTYKHKDDTMYFPNKGIAAGVDYHAGPHERSRIASKYGIDTNTIAGSPVDRSGPSRWDTWSGDEWAGKKGGRVGCGKAKRGFGRALKKK